MTEGQTSLAKSLVLLLAGHVSITAGGQHQIWSRKNKNIGEKMRTSPMSHHIGRTHEGCKQLHNQSESQIGHNDLRD